MGVCLQSRCILHLTSDHLSPSAGSLLVRSQSCRSLSSVAQQYKAVARDADGGETAAYTLLLPKGACRSLGH